jgi:hypothetical protein
MEKGSFCFEIARIAIDSSEKIKNKFAQANTCIYICTSKNLRIV